MVKIKDIIVVEGRDDQRAVKQSVNAEVIITRGFGLTEETFNRIAVAQHLTGVIIFTDPDHAGEQIRRRINDRIQGCKNAFLNRDKACQGSDIGVEHACPEDIVAALLGARCNIDHSIDQFTHQMLLARGLVGAGGAARKRAALGSILGIGYANGRQFLNRLNRYGISQRRFHEALEALGAQAPVRCG